MSPSSPFFFSYFNVFEPGDLFFFFHFVNVLASTWDLVHIFVRNPSFLYSPKFPKSEIEIKREISPNFALI